MALLLGIFILALSAWLGPRRPSSIKSEAFEGGNPSSGQARERFHVRFYLVAILFVVFDIETVFAYPWALVFNESARGNSALSPWLLAGEMLVFVAVMVVALVYAWRKGALDWGPERAPGHADE